MSRESPFLSREPLSGEEHQPEVADLSQPGTLIQQTVRLLLRKFWVPDFNLHFTLAYIV